MVKPILVTKAYKAGPYRYPVGRVPTDKKVLIWLPPDPDTLIKLREAGLECYILLAVSGDHRKVKGKHVIETSEKIPLQLEEVAEELEVTSP